MGREAGGNISAKPRGLPGSGAPGFALFSPQPPAEGYQKKGGGEVPRTVGGSFTSGRAGRSHLRQGGVQDRESRRGMRGRGGSAEPGSKYPHFILKVDGWRRAGPAAGERLARAGRRWAGWRAGFAGSQKRRGEI